MTTRTLREKLKAMAERGTEHEAAVARTKLEAMGAEPPRRPPTRNAAPSVPPDWSFGTSSTGTTSWGGQIHTSLNITIRFG